MWFKTVTFQLTQKRKLISNKKTILQLYSLICHTYEFKCQSRKLQLALLTKKLRLLLVMTSFDNKIILKQLKFANREFTR